MCCEPLVRESKIVPTKAKGQLVEGGWDALLFPVQTAFFLTSCRMRESLRAFIPEQRALTCTPGEVSLGGR